MAGRSGGVNGLDLAIVSVAVAGHVGWVMTDDGGRLLRRRAAQWHPRNHRHRDGDGRGGHRPCRECPPQSVNGDVRAAGEQGCDPARAGGIDDGDPAAGPV